VVNQGFQGFRDIRDDRIAHRPVGLASVFSTVLLAETIRTVLPTGAQLVIDVGGGEAPYAGWVAGQMHVAVDRRTPPDTLASHQIVGDACALPLADGAADLILCTEVVEHVFDEHALYRELRRVVRPGGSLVLSSPFVHGLHESPHDYRRPTSAGLVHGLRHAGFEIEAVHAVGSTADVLRDLLYREVAPHVARGARGAPGPLGRVIRTRFRARQAASADRSLRRSAASPAGIDPMRARPRLTLGYVVLARPAAR
jgi:SAM-dependent methyltransferase